MPLGTKDDVNTFTLGGYKLQAMAPQELRTGITAAFRFFFYKAGPARVQKGPVTPDPITLSFRLHGPSAVDAELFIRAMAAKQGKLALAWLNRFRFQGYITKVGEFTHTRLWVTGTITYQPTEDTSSSGSAAALTAAPPTTAATVQGWLDALNDTINQVLGDVAAIKATVQADLSPITDATTAASAVITATGTAMNQVASVADLPFQTASALVARIDDARLLLPTAAANLKNVVLAPPVQILGVGTPYYQVKAAGHDLLSGLDDADDHLGNLANTLKPQPHLYTSQYGDTLTSIADLFGVTLGPLLALNSGLTGTGRIPAGTAIQVPPPGS